MILSPQVSAAASSDAYNDRIENIADNKPVNFDGHEYRVFDYKDDSATGFHATAYQDIKTHAIIIRRFQGPRAT